MGPTVSIVINNYNYGRFLAAAIDSALTQEYSPLDVIVVDDGSTDESRDVIANYGNRIVAVLKDNAGQASALNAGFAASRGDVLVFLDADDALLPTAVSRAVSLFEHDVVKVHWPMAEIDTSGQQNGHCVPPETLAEGDLRDQTMAEGPATTVSAPMSGNAWARTFLDKVMPIPEAEHKISADAYLFGLAPAFGRIRRIDAPLGLYRFHGNNNYRAATFEQRLEANRRTVETQWRVLMSHCQANGVVADPAAWKRRSFFHRLRAAIDDLDAVLPPEARFILIDEEQWGADDTVASRPRIPFVERDGGYWGRPDDDLMAIRELERLREDKGAMYLAVAWPAFWWLDYYAGFAAHVRTRYPCVRENDNVLLFRLRS